MDLDALCLRFPELVGGPISAFVSRLSLATSAVDRAFRHPPPIKYASRFPLQTPTRSKQKALDIGDFGASWTEQTLAGYGEYFQDKYFQLSLRPEFPQVQVPAQC